MGLYSRVQVIAGCIWRWIKTGNHWVALLIGPVVGVLLLLRKRTEVTVVGSELPGANEVSDRVRTDLIRRDAEALAVRDRAVQQAASTRDRKVDDLLKDQQEETTTLADSPNALTDTMLRVGKDVRR